MSNGIIARTNNPLERFNREMNSAFPTLHPNLPTFVSTIEEMARRHVATLEAVRGRRAARRPIETITLPRPVALESDVDSDSSGDEDDEGEAEDNSDGD